jgi:large subunit ribosomal protein L21
VAEGDTLEVETIDGAAGSDVNLADVLMVVDGDKVTVGAPFIAGASVTATVVAQTRGPKVRIVKFRRRKHYRKQMGHRQNLTQLKITKISAGA